MVNLCLHGYVSGRVQGVGFRQSMAAEAVRLGLSGWVRNLDDGRVEVLFEGEEDAARALASWLESGPPLAVVTSFDLQEKKLQGIQGFVVR